VQRVLQEGLGDGAVAVAEVEQAGADDGARQAVGDGHGAHAGDLAVGDVDRAADQRDAGRLREGGDLGGAVGDRLAAGAGQAADLEGGEVEDGELVAAGEGNY
jgi:hypothetical protein